MTSKQFEPTPSDLVSLARFVADAQAHRPEAWKRVELLRAACALALLAAETQGLASRHRIESPTPLPMR